MPPKRARAAAAVNTTPVFTGSEPRSFQLPPYREDRPSLWFRQAEGQMTRRNITNEYFKVILVQAALTNAQQDAVASILEQEPLPSDAYQSLKAELIRLHEKSSWDRIKELFALPPLGAQKATELLATMQHLKPADPELWFRYQYFSRLPADIQRLLAEHKGSVEELAARADELQRKAPPTAAAATIAAAPVTDNVVAAAHARPPKKQWNKQKPDNQKRKRSQDAQGGGAAPKRRPPRDEPWTDAGLCFYHWSFGSQATRCDQPCYRKSGN
jgi:hypothetical protein